MSTLEAVTANKMMGPTKERRLKHKNRLKENKENKKGDDRSLVAVIGTTNELENPADLVTGIATVNFNQNGAFLLALDLANIPVNRTQVPISPNATAAAFITNSKDCNELLCDTDLRFPSEDDSEQFQQIVLINPNFNEDSSFSNDAGQAYNGFGSDDNKGYAIIIVSLPPGPTSLDYDEVIGCGILDRASDNEPSDSMFLEATIGVYPDYTPGLEVSGSVVVSYRADGTFKFSYDLEGVDPACADGCGIHIHAGTSCDTADQVQGHGWNSDVVQDLWTPEGGAVYVANDMGKARGFFNLYNGFSFGKNLGHAVVVHTDGGARVGCGVLEASV